MFRWNLLFACCLLCTTNAAVANIHVWEGTAAHCTLDHDNNTITINEPGTYGFRAFDPNDPNDPNDVLTIKNIDLDPNLAGTVTVTVAWDENGGNGAADVWAINLATDGNVECATITGNITVNGNMATGGDVDCDNLVGNITVAGTHGDGPGSTTYRLHADTGTGNITITGDCVGNLELVTYNTGEITIGGLLLGDLDAGNPHDVTIQGVGTHEGNISITGDDYYAHDLAIGDSGNQTSVMTGDIDINYGTCGHGGDTGWIRIHGKMYGSSRLFGLC